MNSFYFLSFTLLDLVAMLLLVRVWLQMVQADFFNPFSQFVAKSTQPIVGQLRRVIPSIGNIDTATLLLAYIVCTLKAALVIYLQTKMQLNIAQYAFYGVMMLIKTMGGLLFWVLIIRAIMSWVSQGRSTIEYVMHQLTEPLLRPIRGLLPNTGGLDFSILILFILLQFANYLIGDFLTSLSSLGFLWYKF